MKYTDDFIARHFRSTDPVGGVLTQLHAWWHVLMAYSSYCTLVIRYAYNNTEWKLPNCILPRKVGVI